MTSNLTTRETQILISVIKYATIDNKTIDWAKVADDAHFNTPKQARDRFAGARNKLLALSPGSIATMANGVGKGAAKRKKISRDSEDADEGNVMKKPKTGGKAGKGKGKKAASSSSELNGTGDESEGHHKAAVKSEPLEGGSDGDDEI